MSGGIRRTAADDNAVPFQRRAGRGIGSSPLLSFPSILLHSHPGFGLLANAILITVWRTILCASLAVSCVAGQAPPASALKALYDAQRWSELAGAIHATRAPALYRGAVGVVFHQNPRRCESLLRSVIAAQPESQDAYQAYEWLSHLFLYSGRYRSLISTMEARWSAFPGKPEQEQEKSAMAGFRGLPDQVTVAVHPSTLRHEDRSIFIPLTINGSPATFFFDTGAWPNVVSESEARRLRLRFTDTSGSMGTMTNKVAFRAAVADELIVGGVRLKNVSFTVLPDSLEPWSLLPPGRRGLLGMPVILAFRTLRWAQDGTVRIGGKPRPFQPRGANLMFDNDHLAVTVTLDGRAAVGSVDTGAETTDLFRELALRFPSLMQAGKKGSTEIRGVGGAASYESVTLPEFAFEIGGFPAILRSREVLMQRAARSYIGNFGMDTFQQGRAFKLDFTAMRLELEPVR